MSLVEVEVPRERADANATPEQQDGAARTREVRHEYTRSLPPLLSQLGVSLLVSTYQAGKVAAVGVAEAELALSYHNFERAMGLAVKPGGLAVAARAQIWFLHAAHDLAARVEPAGTTPASSRAPPTSLARSRPTSWPGRAMSSGWSTRPSAVCARSTAGTASCRAGGRRS